MISFGLPKVLSLNGLNVPLDFPYLATIFQGPPEHDHDAFSFSHPKMDRGKRAKIFAPFDALDGYGAAIRSKDVEYTARIDLSEEDGEELSRRLDILHKLTCSRRMARANSVVVTVTYFVPCADENSFAYGVKGLYNTATGVCWKVDSEETNTITVGSETIPIDSIAGLEADKVFEAGWATERAEEKSV
ncbi:MAG: hypothetical protein J5998_00975 [Clostridia bacterium]|nr:hypothetical protein [Clostridia bacterium]